MTGILPLLLLAAFWAGPGTACTLFGVAGKEAAGRGPIVVKNRDREETGRQEVKLVRPKGGFAYFALTVAGRESPGVKAGINEKGLTVLSATASTLPKAERKAARRRRGLMVRLLKGYATVAEAAASGLEGGPCFLLLADAERIAYAEVPPSGKPSVRIVESGHLAHTNHYLGLTEANRKSAPDDGSHVRLERVEALLSAAKAPLDAAGMRAISSDRHDGPDKSLFRTGSAPDKPATLAVWMSDYSDPADPRVSLWLKDGPGFEKTLKGIFKAAGRQED